MKRAQITVEYLIILVIMVLLFTGISMDLSNYSLSNAMQVQTSQLIKSANYSLLNYAGMMQIQGAGSSRTVSIRAPSDCIFQIKTTHIRVSCPPTSFSKDYDNVQFAYLSVIAPNVTYSCPSCVGGVNGNISAGDVQIVKVTKA